MPATALPGNGWRPFGRLVDGNGAFVSASTRLSSIAGAYDANSVAFNALTQSFFLVTHGATTLQDVGFEISGTGTPVSTASAVTSVTAANLTGTFNPRIGASSQASRWLVATSASFASLWTQVIAGDGVAPPPGGGGDHQPAAHHHADASRWDRHGRRDHVRHRRNHVSADVHAVDVGDAPGHAGRGVPVQRLGRRVFRQQSQHDGPGRRDCVPVPPRSFDPGAAPTASRPDARRSRRRCSRRSPARSARR